MRILLAGTARCGSTWAANVLSHAADTRAVSEPDGPYSDILGAMVATRLGEFPVLTAGERNRWYSLVWDLAFAGGWPWDKVEAARAAGRRMVRIPPTFRDYAIGGLAEVTRRVQQHPRNVIVKSVNSAFTLEWIAQQYHPEVVVLRRNPLNVVSSWVVLQMGSDSFIGRHPRVQEAYLRPLGITIPNGSTTAVALAAYNVGVLTKALKEAAARHPEWILVSHDELCLDPLPKFRELTARLGLQWTTAMEEYLRRSDDPAFIVHDSCSPEVHPNAATATTDESRREQQATQFKRRLTPEQTAEARRVLESFDLGEWGPPPS